MAELMNVGVHLEGFNRKLDFDKKQVRAAMRKIGQVIRRDARADVSMQAVVARGRHLGSVKGEFPRKLTGKLRRSIGYKVSRPGFLVMIRPQPKTISGDFYPAFLHYGVTGKPRRQDHKAQVKDGSWRIAPRKNYMTDALQRNEGAVRKSLYEALSRALKVV